MKKRGMQILIAATVCFCVFVFCFFFYRNLRLTPVQIQIVPAIHTEDVLDINTATYAQLQMLPGIGESLAQYILAYREANGPFERIGELIFVPGIGKSKLEAIWDLVTAGG